MCASELSRSRAIYKGLCTYNVDSTAYPALLAAVLYQISADENAFGLPSGKCVR